MPVPTPLRLLPALLLLPLLRLHAADTPPAMAAPTGFRHSLTATAKPWTHERFPAADSTFHVAVVADRTGGMRPGVFETALRRVNLLAPDFVLCVGDLIEGMNRDPAVLARQWDELDRALAPLDMPFFRVAGNHDLSNPDMARLYEQRFGARYYWFRFRGVLFMVLDSQDTPACGPGLSPAQITWARATLAAHADARWTFVFTHQPLWLANDQAHTDTTGFGQVEEAIGTRPATVIAGHLHGYSHNRRNGRDYLILATTGGASPLTGPKTGLFDQLLWISVGDGDPRFAVLDVNGILDWNLRAPGTP